MSLLGIWQALNRGIGDDVLRITRSLRRLPVHELKPVVPEENEGMLSFNVQAEDETITNYRQHIQ